MKNIHRQRGLALFSLIYNLVALVSIVYAGIILGPVYLENHTVEESLQSIKTENLVDPHDTLQTINIKIRQYLFEKFRMNNVAHVSSDDIHIERDGNGGVKVKVAYSVRKNVIANVNFLLEFNNHIVVH